MRTLLIFAALALAAMPAGAGVIQPPSGGSGTQNANWVFFAWDFTDPGVNGDGQMLLLTFQDLPTLGDTPTTVIGDSGAPAVVTNAPPAVPEPGLLAPVAAALLAFTLWRSSRGGRRSPSA